MIQIKRWDAFQKHLTAENDNPLLSKAKELFPRIDSYGWYLLERFKMAAIIPSNGEQSYYCVGGYGVAFISDESTRRGEDRFIFDSEFFARESCSTEQKREVYSHHFRTRPVVVFFLGCDDGHVGMRFATRDDAMSFLRSLDVFEDVFKFSKNSKEAHEQIEAGVIPAALDMTLCYHN